MEHLKSLERQTNYFQNHPLNLNYLNQRSAPVSISPLIRNQEQEWILSSTQNSLFKTISNPQKDKRSVQTQNWMKKPIKGKDFKFRSSKKSNTELDSKNQSQTSRKVDKSPIITELKQNNLTSRKPIQSPSNLELLLDQINQEPTPHKTSLKTSQSVKTYQNNKILYPISKTKLRTFYLENKQFSISIPTETHHEGIRDGKRGSHDFTRMSTINDQNILKLERRNAVKQVPVFLKCQQIQRELAMQSSRQSLSLRIKKLLNYDMSHISMSSMEHPKSIMKKPTFVMKPLHVHFDSNLSQFQ